MNLEEEITILSDKWFTYVSQEHHKDRDCHWFIEKKWSYGKDPVWVPYHNGYIGEAWTGPECETELMAQTILRDRIKKELILAIEHCQNIIHLDEENGWGMSKEIAQKVLDYIGNINE